MTRTPGIEFSVHAKAKAMERTNGRCDTENGGCGIKLTNATGIEYHHIEEAWTGRDATQERIAYLKSAENCAPLCRNCHAPFTAETVRIVSSADKKGRKNHGIRPKPRRRLPYRKFDGTPVDPNREARR